jgi:hypothetical protein
VLLVVRAAAGVQTGGVSWEPPRNLSNSPTLSAYPAIVADTYGYLHVLWSEELTGEAAVGDESMAAGSTLLYSRFDGTSWSVPVDLFYLPYEPNAAYPRLVIDDHQRLHLVWTGMENVYYSNAPALEAYSARSWLEPFVISESRAASRFDSSVAVDRGGAIYVAYAGRGEEHGIWYRRSEDSGATWSPPAALTTQLRTDEASFSTVQVIVDSLNVIHVVWQTSDGDGYDRGVYYTRSTDEGRSWAPALTVKYTDATGGFLGWPFLFASSTGRLHLVYTRENNKARYYRISDNQGESWGEEQIILPEMEGINGYVFPLEDNAGNLHLIANLRTQATQEIGIYYAAYDHGVWSTALPVAVGAAAPSAHYAAGAVRLGNELNVVWTDIDGGEIWYERGFIKNVTAAASPGPTPVTPAATGLTAPAGDVVPPSAQSPRVRMPDTSLGQPTAPHVVYRAIPMLFSLSATLVIVSGVLLWRRYRTRT